MSSGHWHLCHFFPIKLMPLELSQVYLHLMMECYCVHSTLLLGRSENTQFAMSIPGHMVTCGPSKPKHCFSKKWLNVEDYIAFLQNCEVCTMMNL